MDSYNIITFKGSELPQSYKAMIFSKWLRSLRYGNDYFKLTDATSYFEAYHKFIESLLLKGNCIVKLAVLTEDPDCVLGFSVGRRLILDYVHVHKDYRRTGIGTSLTFGETIFITHLTKQGMSFWNNRLRNAKFNPFV